MIEKLITYHIKQYKIEEINDIYNEKYDDNIYNIYFVLKHSAFTNFVLIKNNGNVSIKFNCDVNEYTYDTNIRWNRKIILEHTIENNLNIILKNKLLESIPKVKIVDIALSSRLMTNFEVLYIGSSDQNLKGRNIKSRLKNHKTIQKILIESSNSPCNTFIMYFKFTPLRFGFDITKTPLKFYDLNNLSKTESEALNSKTTEDTKLIEMVLINIFKPYHNNNGIKDTSLESSQSFNTLKKYNCSCVFVYFELEKYLNFCLSTNFYQIDFTKKTFLYKKIIKKSKLYELLDIENIFNVTDFVKI